jgi:hypothetical protein
MSEAGGREYASDRPADPVREGFGLSRSFGPIEVLSDPKDSAF